MKKKFLLFFLSFILAFQVITPLNLYAEDTLVNDFENSMMAMSSYVGVSDDSDSLLTKIRKYLNNGQTSVGGEHRFLDNGDGTVSFDQDTCDVINNFYQTNYYDTLFFNAAPFTFSPGTMIKFGDYDIGSSNYLRFYERVVSSDQPVYAFVFCSNPSDKEKYRYIFTMAKTNTSLPRLDISSQISSGTEYVSWGGDMYWARYYSTYDFGNRFSNWGIAGEYKYYHNVSVTPNLSLLPADDNVIKHTITDYNSWTKRVMIYFLRYGLFSSQSVNYYTSNYNPVTTNVKFNKNVITNTDWKTVNNKTYNSVVNNIKIYQDNNDGNISDNVINDIVTDATKKIYNALLNITTSVNNVSESVDGILDEIMIFHSDTNNRLAEIIFLLSNLPSSGGSGTSDLDYTTQLNNILKAIQNNKVVLPEQIDYSTRLDQVIKVLEDILESDRQIEKLLEKDNDGLDFFDLLKLKFASSGDLMSKRFPTSVPWDIAHAFKMFKADPVAPEFHIPIKSEKLGITETIDIDLSENSTVSNMTPIAKTSRTLLTGLFIMFLIALTRKLFGGDK